MIRRGGELAPGLASPPRRKRT